jgi:outer membrane protein assembly factor BamB
MRNCLLLLSLSVGLLHGSDNWPQFRGPSGDGQSDSTGLPLTWNEQEHVKWKTAIPGEGWSSPVIEGNQVWMQTALDNGKSLRAVCVDRQTGRIQHDVELFYIETPERKHAFNSFASPTPVIESGRLYVSYGMYGVVCVEASTGKILWKNTELKHDHDKNGPGSSPIIYKDLFILNCDGTEARYVAAVNKLTGKVAWKTDRSNVINKAGEFKKAYHTPLIISVHGRDQLVSMGAFRVSAYEPLTGKEIWWVDIPGFSNVPRPVFGHGMVYLPTGFMKPELWAIRADGYGDVTKTHVAWKVARQAPAKPSPLLIGEQLYMFSDSGIATCLDAKTGKEIWSERIGGDYSASPVFADGRIYLFSEQGKTLVIKPDTKLNLLATNSLENGFMSSPAVAGKAFFVRTKKHLYRIEE